jgi:hypothetical protein
MPVLLKDARGQAIQDVQIFFETVLANRAKGVSSPPYPPQKRHQMLRRGGRIGDSRRKIVVFDLVPATVP